MVNVHVYDSVNQEQIKLPLEYCIHKFQTAAHTHDRLQSWGRLPDVPYCSSSVCIVDGVLLALGGAEGQSGSRKFNTIYGFHPIQKVWQHVGDMPFECSFVDSLLMTDNSLLVADGDSQKVLKITVEGNPCLSQTLLSYAVVLHFRPSCTIPQ